MPSKETEIRAVIYARYSSHAQNEQSIDGQLHDAYAFAERHGWNVIGEYIDRALTGTKDARPDFQRMIRDAEKRQFQVVIVWKLDRFARNRYDSAIYKAKLKKFGVRVVSVMENVGDGPEAIILEGILESMAEYYSANLSENVRRGMQEMIRKGWFPGGAVPHGWRVENHHLYLDERHAPVLREIARRYADGESPSTIIRDINARGYRSRTGKPFTLQSLKFLDNPVCVGRFTYDGQEVPGAADPLLDEETWQRVQSRRQANRQAPAAHKAKERYLLSGKIFCGHCGSPMIGECGRSRGGDMYHYYTCAARKKSHTCKKKNEKKDFVEWYVCEQTVEYILDPDRLDLIASRVVAIYNSECSDTQVEDLERRLKRIDADTTKLVDDLLLLPSTAKAARQKIYDRMEQLENEKADTEVDLAKARLTARLRLTEDQVRAWLRTFQHGDLFDLDFRQRIIDTFINSVYLYDEKLVIFYNLRDSQQVCGIGPIDTLDQALSDCSDSPSDGVPPPRESEPRLICVEGLVGILFFRH